MPKEKRPNTMKFRVSDEERAIIEERMNRLGIMSIAAYLRKMAIDGYILTLNMSEIRELIFLMRNMSNNQNQIAKRVNMSGNIYADDLAEIKSQQQRLWDGINEILGRLGKKI